MEMEMEMEMGMVLGMEMIQFESGISFDIKSLLEFLVFGTINFANLHVRMD